MKKIFLFISLFISFLYAKELQKITLQLQEKHQFKFAGFYAAKELGYYKDLGLDIKFVEYDEKKKLVNIVLSKEFAQNNPQIVKNFKLASNKGWEYALKHKEKTIDIILKKYNTQNQTKQALLFEAKQIEQIMLTQSKKIENTDLFQVQLIDKNFIASNYANGKNLPSLDMLLFQDSYKDSTKLLTPIEKQYLKNNIIKIGMVKDYYPFSYKENNQIRGFAYEYFKLLASKVDMTYSVQIDYWSKIFGKFKNKDIDIIDSISYTKERELFTNFSDPYFNIPNVIFTRKNTIKNYSGLESLKGKKVGITEDIYYFDKIKNLNLFEIISFKSSREKIKALAYGKIDAAFNNLTSGQKYILQGGYSNLEVIDEISNDIIKKEDLRLGIHKQNPILTSIITKASQKITLKEKLNLINKYFSSKTKNSPLVNRKDQNIIQSVEKMAESISEYVWTYRLDLLITSLKRWLEFFNYESACFYDKEINEYLFIWRENGILKHKVSQKKPQVSLYESLENLTIDVTKNKHHLGQLTIFYKKQNEKNSLTISNKEKEYLKNKNYISMCIDPNWEPYETINKNGIYEGLAADFIRLIEKKINKEIRLVKTTSWSESLHYIKQGKCEILSFLNETPKRKDFLNFTPTLYEEVKVIITKDDVTYIDSLKQLNNKTIGVVRGYKIDEYIQDKFPDINIKYIKNYEEAFKLVSEGKIDATVNSLLSSAYIMKKLNLFDIKIVGTIALKNRYKIGVTKTDKILHSILTKAVNSITEKEKNTLASNWTSIKFENKIDYTLVLKILLGGFVLFILFSYWTYRLKFENKKRMNAEQKLKKLNLELEDRIQSAIEENQKKEKILLQQTRLAQMGEMISMIAHQWRQPIGAINSAVIATNLKIESSKFKNLNPKQNEELLEYILEKNKNISNYIQFLSTTVDDFRNFFQPNKQKELTKISELIDNTLLIIEESIKTKNIALNKKYITDFTIELYKNEMIQVILNMLKNSEDQLLENHIQDPIITIEIKNIDNSCQINIYDNGGGIPEDIIENIFDPYFSTKDEKNGTGLGLYMSKVIVEDHNQGTLTVHNTKDGACFTISFKTT